MNIKEQYERNTRPVNATIKKILIGKVFTFGGSHLVILGLRRNSLYGYLEILCGHLPLSKKYGYGNSISVYSWYAYQPKNMRFIGRDTKAAIRNCLRKNPGYIGHHIGKQLDPRKFILYEQPPIHYVYGDIIIHDNCNYYKDYLNSK